MEHVFDSIVEKKLRNSEPKPNYTGANPDSRAVPFPGAHRSSQLQYPSIGLVNLLRFQPHPPTPEHHPPTAPSPTIKEPEVTESSGHAKKRFCQR